MAAHPVHRRRRLRRRAATRGRLRCWSTDGRVVGRRARCRPTGRRGRGRRRRGRAGRAGLHRRPRPPDPGRPGAAPLRPVGAWRRGRSTSPPSRRTPPRTPSCRGSSAAAGRCPPSRAAPRPPPTSTRSCPDRPVFLPNRDHHGAWVNRGRSSSPGIDRDTPDPADGRIEREPTADRAARCTRARRPWSRGCCRGPRGRTTTRHCSPARPTSTRSASPAGRTRSSGPTRAWTTPASTYVAAAGNGDLTSDVVGALWWERRQRRRAGGRPGRAGARR